MPNTSGSPRADRAGEVKLDVFVSVVAAVRNDAVIVQDFIRETLTVLDGTCAYYELLLIDDGSTDGTVQRVQDLLDTLPCIRLIRLSRHFGDEIAVYAGLESAIGDYVVTLMPATDPPSLIPELVETVMRSGGIVIGVRNSARREPFTSRLGAKLFYAICNRFLGLEVPEQSTHFRALSRRALNALLQIKDKYRYMKVFSTYIGYQHQTFAYGPAARPGSAAPQRGFRTSVNLAVNVMVANSTRLLRLVTGLGVVASGLNLLYMLYIVGIALFKKHVAEGWITLSAQNAGMFFFICIILSVLGEYIGRILAETQDRPLYYVMEERSSAVLVLEPQQKNVVTESKPHG
jgi:glycosyltransferase involved in cell wall biosynthesis